jgi:hypothetical protein
MGRGYAHVYDNTCTMLPVLQFDRLATIQLSLLANANNILESLPGFQVVKDELPLCISFPRCPLYFLIRTKTDEHDTMLGYPLTLLQNDTTNTSTTLSEGCNGQESYVAGGPDEPDPHRGGLAEEG